MPGRLSLPQSPKKRKKGKVISSFFASSRNREGSSVILEKHKLGSFFGGGAVPKEVGQVWWVSCEHDEGKKKI